MFWYLTPKVNKREKTRLACHSSNLFQMIGSETHCYWSFPTGFCPLEALPKGISLLKTHITGALPSSVEWPWSPTSLFFLLLVPFLSSADHLSKETQSSFRTSAFLRTVNKGMHKGLPHTCKLAPFQTCFLPLGPVICKDYAYSLGHKAISQLWGWGAQ